MVGQLSVRDETPQAIGSTRHGWQVRDLLATCQEILDNVGDLPLVPMVLRRHGGTTALSPSSQMGSALWPPFQADGGMADVADDPPRLSTMRGVEPRCVHHFVFVVFVA
jgi:hypothetical protein